VSETEGKPAFDRDRAAALIGKHVLIGVTTVDHDGKVLEQKQMHGTIALVDERRGVKIELKGARDGEEYWLPPDLSSFEDAPPGEYRLRSNGEVVVDPDLLSSWTVKKPRLQ
jgi:hypothetical protein